jgi:sec-independent protein translocase protein TatB
VQAPPRYAGKVFGLTFDKLLIVAVIAAFVIGPERLPTYAAKLGQLVRTLRDFANGAKERMRDEMGPEFDDVDWKKLDPRQYDPRRIVREALLEDSTPPSAIKPVTQSAYAKRKLPLAAGAVPPFDTEST